MAEREKIISLIILSLLSFVFSFCVSLHKTGVFLPKCLQGGGVPGTALRGADSSQG